MKTENIESNMEDKEKKLDRILNLLNEEGKTQTQVAKEMGYKSGDSIGKILKRAGYVRNENKKYESIDTSNESKRDSSNNIDISNILRMINDMSKKIEKLEGMDTSSIQVSNQEMNYQATSIRVDQSTLTAFNQVCEKFSNVSKSYLITLALQEFVDKYGDNK